MQSTFRKRRTHAGASPGTLALPAEPAPMTLHVIRYDATRVEEHEVAGPEGLAALLAWDGVVWVDVVGFGDDATFRRVGDLFGIHPLALEDLVHVPQRPKAEDYDDHLLLITRMLAMDASQELETEQLGLVLRRGCVVTFQERPGDVLEPVRARIRLGKGLIRRAGADYLAYALVDTVIDGYFPVLEAFSDQLEALEERVMTRATPAELRALNQRRNALLHVRRAIWPQRDALQRLVRDEHALVAPEVRVYLRDTHDHCVQMADVVESYRELVSGLLNTYLSVASNQMNRVMQVLTIVATIFIPLTFLAGIYGMNFEVMPELKIPWAYPALIAVMLLVAAAMVGWFRRQGWLGGTAQNTSDAADGPPPGA